MGAMNCACAAGKLTKRAVALTVICLIAPTPLTMQRWRLGPRLAAWATVSRGQPWPCQPPPTASHDPTTSRRPPLRPALLLLLLPLLLLLSPAPGTLTPLPRSCGPQLTFTHPSLPPTHSPVVGSLPVELAKRGHHVISIAPRYDQYWDAWDTDVVINVDGEDVRFFHSIKNGVHRVWIDHPWCVWAGGVWWWWGGRCVKGAGVDRPPQVRAGGRGVVGRDGGGSTTPGAFPVGGRGGGRGWAKKAPLPSAAAAGGGRAGAAAAPAPAD